MKAILIQRTGGPEVLEYVDVADPKAKPGQIVVRNEHAGVNYIDTYQRNGTYPVPLPYILGREGAGVVEEVGEGVEEGEFRVGDRVAYLGTDAYAQLTAVNATHAIKLPSNVSTKTAAAALLQGMTTVCLTFDCYKVKKGDYVVIPAAAGGVGSLLCQICNYLGAIVIGLVSNQEKEAFAKHNGAHHIINYVTHRDIVPEVLRITKGKGAQVVYDGVGQAIYPQLRECLAKRGHYIYFGNASGTITSINPFDLSPKCLTFMRPALFRYVETGEEFKEVARKALELLSTKTLNIHIHQEFALEEAAKAHCKLENRETMGKVVLRI